MIDRAASGETITITRDGTPVAELRALRRAGLSAETLIERRRRLPAIDPDRLRAEIDAVLDAGV